MTTHLMLMHPRSRIIHAVLVDGSTLCGLSRRAGHSLVDVITASPTCLRRIKAAAARRRALR